MEILVSQGKPAHQPAVQPGHLTLRPWCSAATAPEPIRLIIAVWYGIIIFQLDPWNC